MSKFKNKPRGRFRSQFEWEISKALRRLQRKIPFKWSHERDRVPYQILEIVDQKRILRPKIYVPDFTITNPTGKVWYLECKGLFTEDQREKMIAVKLCSSRTVRILFMENKKIKGRSGDKIFNYFDWCLHNNIDCDFYHGFYRLNKTLNEEWFR